MTIGYIGSPTGNTIVPISNFTKRTKELDITSAIITGSPSSPSVASVVYAKAIFYADSAGVWRMTFNIQYTVAQGSRPSSIVGIQNITFKTSIYQAVIGTNDNGATKLGAYADGASVNQFEISHASFSTNHYSISGDVELDSEATTYTIAANMQTPTYF